MRNIFIRLAYVVVLLNGPKSADATIVTFDDLANLPNRNSFRSLSDSNGGSSALGGAVWDTRFSIVGDQYVEAFNNQGGSNPFATPHSPSYAVFNSNGQNGLIITTTDVLTGVWLSRPDMGIGPRGTNSVTISALNGATVLGSRSISLVNSTPTFLDTTAFLGFSGISGYRIDRVAIGGDGYNGGHYIADSFQFVAVPEPSSLVLVLALGSFSYLRRRKPFVLR